jgi:hypothetical protein
VAGACGLGPREPFDMAERLCDLIPAIIRHENGIQPYDADTIRRGAAMAAPEE